MKLDICERDFQTAVQLALKGMGEQLRAQKATRHDNVIKRLKEEIERLRPHADRLLHGPSNKSDK